MITSAVMVQITTVSMNGSSSDTKPSVIGSLVRTAEWAMAAEPTPASFEKAARLKPWISAPTMPPAMPSPVKAPAKIWPRVTRASLIVLEKSPHFRDEFYDAQPAADDAEGQAIIARFKGRKLPMIDEVRVSIIQEQQPRWLAFLNEETDFIGGQANDVPPEFLAKYFI